ncbi:flagellar hook protein FlgE [Nitratireductor basaltis]|uniref:Flagellar hook protein FlgE n=1 Tax=Nitratireductor basaltis TaxID=472175 RepID=A0A084U890_9HYPH|nr:flagellar hook protein FlgE [Nitratireductor basaltis]KFB09176.1 Flagellar basal body FlaE [Nitratireductor basaltis]
MSLYGMMRTGVSGMNAQANRLSTVADNIANSSTNGYKRAKTEFSTLVIPSTQGSYNSGGVTTTVRNAISTQGVLQYTTSVTDLAIKGEGFFVVQNPSGQPLLTRAGSFVLNSEGQMVNAGGFQLMGYSYANGEPAATANGYAGLEPVTITQSELVATPTENGFLKGNLPADAEVLTGAPSTTNYTKKTSLVAYGTMGEEMLFDVYMSKTSEYDASTGTGVDEWQVEVYDRATGSLVPGGTATMTFDNTGALTAPANASLALASGQAIELDLSNMTQLGAPFDISDAAMDGAPPSTIESVEIGTDGVIYAQYADGSFKPLYRIPVASVTSPDQLQVLAGNVFTESPNSGAVRIGFAGNGGMGDIVSGAVENSNVDIAQELTEMIESQRSYTANSKVFQTGSDLMELLVNLKR